MPRVEYIYIYYDIFCFWYQLKWIHVNTVHVYSTQPMCLLLLVVVCVCDAGNAGVSRHYWLQIFAELGRGQYRVYTHTHIIVVTTRRSTLNLAHTRWYTTMAVLTCVPHIQHATRRKVLKPCLLVVKANRKRGSGRGHGAALGAHSPSSSARRSSDGLRVQSLTFWVQYRCYYYLRVQSLTFWVQYRCYYYLRVKSLSFFYVLVQYRCCYSTN